MGHAAASGRSGLLIYATEFPARRRNTHRHRRSSRHRRPRGSPDTGQQSQEAGRGGRGGRGGQGGPGATDPANVDADFTKQPPVLPVPAAEQQKHFLLQPGYRIAPVLSDPDIKEPGAIAFDGNGRMFVLELRGYMQDADATGELDPVGRISRHEDADNDGVYERHTVFVDKLVFPRFVMPFGPNSVLTMESNADEVWQFTDTNNDGVSDKKELFTSNFGRSGNVEHQQAFLYWGMDNWLYSTVNAFRVRWTPNGIVREPTAPNGAQWGATQDNDGKMWFQGGASGLPSYFQFPVHYGSFSVPDQFEKDFNIPWGAPVRVADMQPGMRAVRMPDGSLNQVTGSAGNDIYRGDRLPADLVGDLIYGEPIGRIVRRVRPVVTEGLTQLRNAYLWNEFIKSTDPLFRPVDMTTAPDGTLYVTDMYRGIIQQATWSGPGTYLRARIDQYALDKVFGHGRIWRVSYDGMERNRTQPRMLNETPAQLVAHLSHPNGWWRDSAQQLLVLKQDKSVVPALQQIVKSSNNLLARFHALWTLEGLGALDAATARAQMKDANPRMRIQAIRASETLYKAGDRTFDADYRALALAKDRQGRQRRHPGAADAQLPQGAERRRDRARGAGRQHRPRRAGDRQPDSQAADERLRARRPWRTAAVYARRTRSYGARRGDLQGSVLRLPRRRRPWHRATGSGAGNHDGAVARQLGAPAGPSGLRDQNAAARHGRADRGPVVRRRRHGAHGDEPR